MKNLLLDILHQKNKRTELIKKFQEEVLNRESDNNDKNLFTIFKELAYDLDYYEPDFKSRKEFEGYYGDERLEQEIKFALNKIDDLKC